MLADVNIVVKDGRVDTVYSYNKDLDVHVIDLDTTDPDEIDELEEEEQEVRTTQHIVW